MNITLSIEGSSFECSVDYTFTSGYPAKVNALPENCYPAQSDLWEIHCLHVQHEQALWLIEPMEDKIIEAIKAELSLRNK